MDLAIVVVTFNSATCIESCLESVREHLPAAELVVVDNASTDASPEIIEATAEARFVANERNNGFGRACNVGARTAMRSHLLFLNPDVVVTHANVDALERLLETEPFGLFGPKRTVTGVPMGAQPEAALLNDWFEHTIGILRPREWSPRRRRVDDSEARIWLSGAMLLAKRSEFLSLGGFDPRFFLYYEDRDLCARYREAALPIRVTAALEGAHAGSRSSESDDLRVAPAGWAFVAWIEYIVQHRGKRTAQRTARTGILTLRAMRIALVGAAKFARTQRIERKRRQVDELLGFLEEKAVIRKNDDSFCTDARRLLGTLFEAPEGRL
jgi:N-acetylglucosaminyl-diphospho-decaprenol L-rhamnosyltransferase